MKLFSTAFLASSLVTCQHSLADAILPTDPNIRYVGRFDTSNPLAPRMYWSGTHVVAWFEGTSCQVRLNCAGGKDFFNIIVDNGTPTKVGLAAGLQTVSAASGLPDGVHKIEIFKRTSYKNDNSAFEGFVTDAGKGLALLPPEPALKIQFYGDSITDGNSVDHTPEDFSPTYWNNYLTYAATTARNLNMRYVSTAASGIAVIYPSAIFGPGFIMDSYYDRINPSLGSSGANKWDYTNDDTDLAVINLFQNDSTSKAPPHTIAEQNAILDAYESFVLKIRAAHPHAEIICALGNMSATASGSVWPGYIDTVVSRMNNNHGDPKVHSLFFPYKNTGGHPSAAEQLTMANALTAFIQTNFAYLFARDSDSDGFTDVQEANLGTDPHNAGSFFSLAIEPTTSGINGMNLNWPSCTGVKYRVWESDSLSNWTILRDWTDAATPPLESFMHGGLPSWNFFRIEAALP
jgi:hypothetical protein